MWVQVYDLLKRGLDMIGVNKIRGKLHYSPIGRAGAAIMTGQTRG